MKILLKRSFHLKSRGKTKRTDLKAAKVHDNEVRRAAVEARLWQEQIGRFQLDPQVQDLSSLNHVRQTCRDMNPLKS